MFGQSNPVCCALCGCPTNNNSADDFVDCLSNPEFDLEPTTDWLWQVKLITQHRKSGRTFIVPRASQEDENNFSVDYEENARIVRQDVDMMTVNWSDPGRYHTVMSPVDIHDGQATDITGSALRGAHKSNVEDTGPPRNAPTGPAADRGRPPNAPTGAYQNYRTGPYHNQRAQHGNHQIAPQANRQGPRRNQRDKPKQNVQWGKYAVPKDISDEEWENKFTTEFAWVLEFLPSKEEIERREVDRFLFCKAIHDLGRGRGFEGFTSRVYRNTLRALHNRRRLWNLVLGDIYFGSHQRYVDNLGSYFSLRGIYFDLCSMCFGLRRIYLDYRGICFDILGVYSCF
ncbi:hypothetical protein FMUND_8935 [Fusarium mundagurra]|uniref:Uncharacterized protein n=1 Tax=Fusarium mundagurra TaxID=1567541 RepID=A0A8H6DCK2_9HYPO|nr:hypothetical protein FMUND_8935 [Fusarium mundagurra]